MKKSFELTIYDENGEEYLNFIYNTKQEAQKWGDHFCQSHPDCSFSIQELDET